MLGKNTQPNFAIDFCIFLVIIPIAIIQIPHFNEKSLFAWTLSFDKHVNFFHEKRKQKTPGRFPATNTAKIFLEKKAVFVYNDTSGKPFFYSWFVYVNDAGALGYVRERGRSCG